MRLIDAEQLKRDVRKKFHSVADRCEVNELVNAATTIDAIPVDWMRKHSEMYHAIAVVLVLWQKEQEEKT